MAVYLTSNRDSLQQLWNGLFEILSEDSRPVLGMLHNILTGLLKTGQVYVDQWPSFDSVICFHECAEYSPKVDGDWITIYTKTGKSFLSTFRYVADRRNWQQRTFIIHYLDTQWSDKIQQVLHLQPSHVHCFGPYRLYMGDERHRMSEHDLQQLLDEAVAKLPAGFSLSTLIPDEAKIVVDRIWNFPAVPEHEAYIRWLLTIFPSACIRDGSGKPVAFQSSYQLGAGAAGYTEPEYRGLFLHEPFVYSLALVHRRTCPMVDRYGAVADSNQASRHLALKSGGLPSERVYYFFVHNVDYKAKL